jgi:23S rRNA (uridine2552-2'-O)-methyltransferase
MSGKDHYYNKSKQEGYRARSAYKLAQLDDEGDLVSAGDVVVDLGAAPGGWLQVAAERVGEDGVVVGVDRQAIDPLSDVDAAVETVRGDMTEEATRERVRAAVGEATGATPEDDGGGGVDVVVSDLAPNMTGEYSVDQARSVHLARQALATAESLLSPGGHFVTKVFEGRDVDALVEDVGDAFDSVRRMVPDASRDSSSELYVVGKGYLTAPVVAGEELTVEVTDEGAEGDGIARVDGFTLFVPGAAVGETVDVVVTDVKPRFAFAERVDGD